MLFQHYTQINAQTRLLKSLSCLQVHLVKFCCRQENIAQISQENILRTVITMHMFMPLLVCASVTLLCLYYVFVVTFHAFYIDTFII
jgi:hypothetical protein